MVVSTALVLFAGVSSLAAVISCVTNFFGVRANRQSARAANERAKRAEEQAISARELANQIAEARRWQDTDRGREICRQVERNSGRLDLVEQQLTQVATKRDIEQLGGQIGTVRQAVNAAAAGVDRLEEYFIRAAIDAGGERKR